MNEHKQSMAGIPLYNPASPEALRNGARMLREQAELAEQAAKETK